MHNEMVYPRRNHFCFHWQFSILHIYSYQCDPRSVIAIVVPAADFPMNVQRAFRFSQLPFVVIEVRHLNDPSGNQFSSFSICAAHLHAGQCKWCAKQPLELVDMDGGMTGGGGRSERERKERREKKN